ncbi:MAG: hypothetical protein AAF213_12880, partial [Pseudomonadota bacterium]
DGVRPLYPAQERDSCVRHGLVEIRNSGDLRKWLLTMPREVSGIIAARIALRVWPLARSDVFADPDNRRVALLLPKFRAAASPWAAAKCAAQGEERVRVAATHASLAADAYHASRASISAPQDAIAAARDHKCQVTEAGLSVEARAALLSSYRLTGQYDLGEKLYWSLIEQAQATEMEAWLLHFEMACLYGQSGRYEEANNLFGQLLSLVPDHARCLANLYQIALDVCDWPLQRKLTQALTAIANDSQSPQRYYAYLAIHRFSVCDDPKANLAINAVRSKHLFPQDEYSHPARPKNSAPQKIRIGYLGEPFRNHARVHLLTGVLEHHDRQQFHITAFGTGYDDKSVERERFVQAVDCYRDLYLASDQAVAEHIAADQIDILVVTDGWNQGHRMAALSAKPAPIQIAYLGHPCTTGAPFIDYAIVDHHTAPTGHNAEFSEPLIRLAGTYQATDNKQYIPTIPESAAARGEARREHGLPADARVFVSFNQAYKLDQGTVDLWFSILKAVPGSVLWLLQAHPQAVINLQAAAERDGIKAERLIFAPKVKKAPHLDRLALADIGLDPLIYNGHTTTSDALWAGVPVIAKDGRHFASRVAASLLRAADCDQLAVPDIDAYRELAISLGHDHERCRALHDQLIKERLNCRLFDTAAHTQLLEQAYRAVFDRAVAGHRPQAMAIDG